VFFLKGSWVFLSFLLPVFVFQSINFYFLLIRFFVWFFAAAFFSLEFCFSPPPPRFSPASRHQKVGASYAVAEAILSAGGGSGLRQVVTSLDG